MGINSQITVTTILTLAIAGCTIGETPQATNTTSPTPTIGSGTKTEPPTQDFKNPVVEGKNTTEPPQVPVDNLLQSTNATDRIAIVTKGRSDPFAQIVNVPDSPPSPVKLKQVPKLPPLPTLAKVSIKNPQKKSKPVAKTALLPKPKSNSVLPKALPKVIPNPKPAPVVVPQPIQPDMARGIFVSGVVLIGQTPQAIIKAPDEPTSRYVEVGQLLKGGVLVKRIEMNQGVNPTVILEQYGIEVGRTVGEEPVVVEKSKPGSKTTNNNSISMVTPL